MKRGGVIDRNPSTVSRELVRQRTTIEVVFHAAVGHAETHDRFELFGHHSRTRIHAQARRRLVVEHSGIDRLFRPGRHRIAVTHVELKRAARVAQPALQPDAQAAVASILANLLGRKGAGVEVHAVIGNDTADLAQCSVERFGVHRAKAEEVGIARGPMRHVEPQVEQQPTLQPQAVARRRPGQAVQKALDRVPREQQIEILAARLGTIHQSGVNRRGAAGRHATASM